MEKRRPDGAQPAGSEAGVEAARAMLCIVQLRHHDLYVGSQAPLIKVDFLEQAANIESMMTTVRHIRFLYRSGSLVAGCFPRI